MSTHEQTCGYSEDEENLPEGIPPISCDQPLWRDQDHCIWHAKTTEKPVDVLARKWDSAPSRIDGIYLAEIHLSDRLDFEDMDLYNANFSESDLTNANFQGTQLDLADFSEANLRSTKFNSEATNLTGACFEEADCIDTRFQHATLHNANFRSSNMPSAKLQHADAADAVFIDSELHDAKIICTNLRSAELDGAELHQADCGKAMLESASLVDSDLRGTSLVDADLFDTDLRDAEVDHKTNFGTQICREFIADRNAEWDIIKEKTGFSSDICGERGPISDSDPEDTYHSRREEYMQGLKYRYQVLAAFNRLITRCPISSSHDCSLDDLEDAEEIYRNIKQLFRENPVPEQRRQFNIREKETSRKIAYSRGEISWFRWTVLRWTMKYGESTKQVLLASLGAILLGAVIYPIWGIQRSSGEIIRYRFSGNFSIEYIFDFLFYSLRRFISTSDGGLTPLGPNEWIALGQTAIGTLLLAMLVFVLGRRATS
ncbi:pentapeptide repeat-containing protein [Natronorubrum tibetense]|nr:pentapeptide repeat-containing protein [Natronorubrum tibetense]